MLAGMARFSTTCSIICAWICIYIFFANMAQGRIGLHILFSLSSLSHMALFEKLEPSGGRTIDIDPDPHVDSESPDIEMVLIDPDPHVDSESPDIAMGKSYVPNAYYERVHGICFQMKFPSRIFGQCEQPKRFKDLNLSILELNCAQID